MNINFDELHEYMKDHAALYVNVRETDGLELIVSIEARYHNCSAKVLDLIKDFAGNAEDFKQSKNCQELKDYVIYQISGQVLEIFDAVKGLAK